MNTSQVHRNPLNLFFQFSPQTHHFHPFLAKCRLVSTWMTSPQPSVGSPFHRLAAWWLPGAWRWCPQLKYLGTTWNHQLKKQFRPSYFQQLERTWKVIMYQYIYIYVYIYIYTYIYIYISFSTCLVKVSRAFATNSWYSAETQTLARALAKRANCYSDAASLNDAHVIGLFQGGWALGPKNWSHSQSNVKRFHWSLFPPAWSRSPGPLPQTADIQLKLKHLQELWQKGRTVIAMLPLWMMLMWLGSSTLSMLLRKRKFTAKDRPCSIR